jgi:hypothetical protein
MIFSTKYVEVSIGESLIINKIQESRNVKVLEQHGKIIICVSHAVHKCINENMNVLPIELR